MRAADACPGVLRPHRAEDGAMVRLRFPGGRIQSSTLRRLAELAHAYGNGVLQLTSRAGLQLRGLPDPLPTQLVDDIVATGVLPRTSHERVRNIVASPLTSVDGPTTGRADLTALITELDDGLLADPALAGLPGRFLFVLDDGRGDVVDLRFDLGYQALSPDSGLVLVGASDRGLPVAADEAATTVLRLAAAFAEAREESGAWHVVELPDWLTSLELTDVHVTHGTPAVPLGRIGRAASVIAPLARLSLAQVRRIEAVSDGAEVIITPWRGLVLADSAGRLDELVATGLVADEDSAWSQLTACVGAPYCGRARIDTEATARDLVRRAVHEPLPRTHVAGCERRCGAPTGDHVDLVAPTTDEIAARTARGGTGTGRTAPGRTGTL